MSGPAVAAPADPTTVETTAPSETSLPSTFVDPSASSSASEKPSSVADPSASADSSTGENSDATKNLDKAAPGSTESSVVAPLSFDGAGNRVPTSPTRSSTIITVTKGDVRQKDATIGHDFTVGARFQLYYSKSYGNNIGDPIGADWGTCQIEAGDNGLCYFSVPNTNFGGANYNAKFYIRELMPAAGTPAAQNYDIISRFNTGSNGGAASIYQYRTPTLSANRTISMPKDRDKALDGGLDATSGVWANPIKNPKLPQTCESGIRVAMLFDLSGSVKNAGATKTLGEAGKGFVSALKGTGSSVALFSFGDSSPREGTSNYPGLRTIDTGSNSTQINADIDMYVRSFTAAGYTSNGTNWDAGLWSVSQSTSSYDLVVVLTDGNPTFSGTGSRVGPGNSTYFRELESAVFSANAVKAEGARIINVGIGDGLEADFNLSATSGPNKYVEGSSLNTADYLNTNWESLKPLLEDFAKAISCKADITVKKQVENLDGNVAPAEGWTIDAATGAAGVEISPAAPQQTDGLGQVNYGFAFTKPDGSAAVYIEEQQQTGYEFSSAVCTVNGKSVAVKQSEAFKLALSVGDKADCVITNKMLESVATVTKSSNPESETEVAPGDEIDYKLTFTAEGTFPVDIDYVDHLAGVLDDAGLVAGSIKADSGLVAVLNANKINVTGTVSPGKSLTVTYKVKVKTENFGDGVATNFIVPSGETPPETCEPDDPSCTEHPISGDLSITKFSDPESGTLVDPGQTVNYTLKFVNSGAAAVEVDHRDFLSDVLDDAAYVDGSLKATNGLDASLRGDQIVITGKVGAESEATVTYSVEVKTAEYGNGVVKNFLVPDGEDPVCDPEVTNCTEHPVLGSVIWAKSDVNGAALSASEWELTGPGASGAKVGIEDCVTSEASKCSGVDKDPKAGGFQLTGLAWGTYTLVETKAPAGFVRDETKHAFTVGGESPAKIMWDLGQITNEQREGLDLPLTGGTGTQTFLLGGGAVLLAALGIVGWRRKTTTPNN